MRVRRAAGPQARPVGLAPTPSGYRGLRARTNACSPRRSGPPRRAPTSGWVTPPATDGRTDGRTPMPEPTASEAPETFYDAAKAPWRGTLDLKPIKSFAADLARWQRGAECWDAAHGRPRRVLVPPLTGDAGDPLDHRVSVEQRAGALAAMAAADRLRILLCTDRPAVLLNRGTDWVWSDWPAHVGLMIRVRTEGGIALACDAIAAMREAVALPWAGLLVTPHTHARAMALPEGAAIDWLVLQGDIGPRGRARGMASALARSLRDAAAGAGVPFYFAGWGTVAPCRVVATVDRYGQPAYGGRWSGRPDKTLLEAPDGTEVAIDGGRPPVSPLDNEVMVALGRRRAGRLLDGREHTALPAALSPSRRAVA
ncbi:hypothetical protein CCR85_01090 [Rhodothalassium salexigens]|nr:hypothetical protein [Rhodothalassium salexigens]MBK5920701.1 hypothetical protein [Rhodothalassium salexigens]